MWKDKRCWGVSWGHSRSRLDPERTNFIVAPAHSLEGGIIIAKLTLTAKEVLTLEDSHTALSVVLEEGKKHKSTNNAHVIQWNQTFLTLNEWKWCENVKENLQHRRWVWRRSASQCDRHCCLRKHHTGGTLLSPAQTAGPGRRRAHNPPSCWSKRGRDCGLTIITPSLLPSCPVILSFTWYFYTFSLRRLLWKLLCFSQRVLFTHAPLSTLRDRTVSKQNSITLLHSEVNSWRRPWKHSSSKTMIWPGNTGLLETADARAWTRR